MMFKTFLGGAVMAAVGFVSTVAQASLYNHPVASNAYITLGGLNWAWASPIAGNVDLSYEGQFGWRLPTAAELVNAPSALQFIFPGANVPLGGSDPLSGASFHFTASTLNGDAAQASPYFNGTYSYGDWCNAPGSACGFGLQPWAGQPGSVSFSESLVVRSAAPEPASWAMMLLGVFLVGGAARGTAGANRRLAALQPEA